MSDNVMLAILAAIPPTLAGIGAIIVALKNSKKADIANVKADDANVKADRANEKTDLTIEQNKHIIKLANGNLSAQVDRVAQLEQFIVQQGIAVPPSVPLSERKSNEV